MTKLTMDDFDLGYGSERWVSYGKGRAFIGRFKYANPAACARHHVKGLIKLLTKEELEDCIANGDPLCTPGGELLKARGHIHYNIVKAAKVYGVSPQFLNDNPSYGFDLVRAAA